jgi:FMN phosphatase YigB (HAD superfamily)
VAPGLHAPGGLLGYFDAVLTPTELGAAKPAAYAAACRWMRTDPARAVNVGDVRGSDVTAAALTDLPAHLARTTA